MMKTQVLVGMIWAFSLGIISSGICYAVFYQHRATTRVVDLISYLLAGVGLVASLLAIGAYDQRLQNNSRLLALAESSLVAVANVRFTIDKYCGPQNQIYEESRLKKPKGIECTRLLDYWRSLGNLDHIRGVTLPLIPSNPSPTTIDALKALFEIEDVIDSHNQKAQAIFFEVQKNQFSGSVIDDIVTIIYAAYILSFAFGIGVVRRTVDIYSDQKQHEKKRQRKNKIMQRGLRR